MSYGDKDFKNHYADTPSIHTQKVSVNFPSSVDKYLNLQCNGDRLLYTNMPEAKHLNGVFGEINPRNVLEIGGGVGRASVYLAKRFNWHDATFYMLDGDAGEKQICPVGGDGELDFYNSFSSTKNFMSANGIDDQVLLDASNSSWENEVSVKFDLIYSFLSIGFHWPIDLYLDRIHKFCHKDTLLVFGVRGTDRGHSFSEGQISRIDRSKYELVLDARESELLRSSVIVLRAAGGI